MLLRFLRVLVVLIGVSHGVIAALVTAPEMKVADASVTPIQQVLTTILIAGLYFLIAALAFKDLRASTALALAVTFLLTPPLALLLVFSGWSEHSWRFAPWLLIGIAGNVVLFVISAVVIFLLPRGDAPASPHRE